MSWTNLFSHGHKLTEKPRSIMSPQDRKYGCYLTMLSQNDQLGYIRVSLFGKILFNASSQKGVRQPQS